MPFEHLIHCFIRLIEGLLWLLVCLAFVTGIALIGNGWPLAGAMFSLVAVMFVAGAWRRQRRNAAAAGPSSPGGFGA